MKVISVPINKQAEQLLDFDSCPVELLVEWYLTDKEFGILWRSGVFTGLNDKCDKLIDEFEEEWITEQSDLIQSIELINEVIAKNPIDELSRLKNLFSKAIECETGVYFYF